MTKEAEDQKKETPLSKSELKDLLCQLREMAIESHYYCDDCWYTCPKHPEGCCNDEKPDECDCGAEEHNKKVEKTYSAILEKLA